MSTLHRYFAMLDEIGIPVYSERGPHGGFSLVRGYRMPPLVFTPEEAVAIYLGTSLVEVMWVRLEYQGSEQSQLTRRELDPYALVHRWGWWYVVGYCFLMLDGAIRPGETVDTSPAFQEAFEALYGVAYTLKFTSKRRAENPIDYTMMALEGLWWVEDGEFDITRMGNWRWTLMMLQPEHITHEMFSEAVRELSGKKDLPSLERLRFEPFQEGLCMQIMHIGPYAEEMRTVKVMKSFAEENDYAVHGKHHEIYLGDPRRASPEKLRTILRHPIKPI